MQFSAAQIAVLVHGNLEGDASAEVTGFGPIENATENQVSFLSSPKYEEFIYTTRAGVVLINNDLQLTKPVKPTLIRVKDSYSALALLLNKYEELTRQDLHGLQEPVYIHQSASYGEHVYIGAFSFVDANVVIGKNTRIFPGVYIGKNVTIGENCQIDAGVKIYANCRIGNHVNILAGAVIGGDGFGFAPQPDGSYLKIPQMGNVVIEDHVDIGANVTIDRATFGSTIIGKGMKLDNLVHVAHNVQMGENTVIAAQVGISGSTKIGRNVMIGGQAGIVGHIHIGDGAKVNAQSGISKSLEAGKVVTGSPAYEFTASLRSQAVSRRLPELVKRIQELETLIRQMKEDQEKNVSSAVKPH